MISIRSITENDWAHWRSMRLSALAEAPDAFRSTLAEWTGENDSEQRWRDRLVAVPFNLLACLDGQPVGMASATAPAGDEVELISMWVSPTARGKGAGDALIEEIATWARLHGASQLILEVRHDNNHARRLYARNGFVDAGSSANSDPRFVEVRMVRQLA